jgi:hypothetical protein
MTSTVFLGCHSELVIFLSLCLLAPEGYVEGSLGLCTVLLIRELVFTNTLGGGSFGLALSFECFEV